MHSSKLLTMLATIMATGFMSITAECPRDRPHSMCYMVNIEAGGDLVKNILIPKSTIPCRGFRLCCNKNTSQGALGYAPNDVTKYISANC
ncbi:hypothetical protein MJO28_009317 [Puccinia striiformis f. sp. tritici]|uniref:Hydrophobin n=4 Tax=Puccinia striiformis TaxID=27350 RepID=A0A0L0VWZ2_9BASI|nr:hypothetical protein MJO28_009317 [Puccinia striiformis f. sp. tritici]KAI7950272.1 hypothetical protein MJO29_008946 [Puccinia striiformis f. sp. tritici]KNF03786.1 hypothetical protein PSTG_02881 [Puccinia striiformis f. sp. tritici PST-78]POW14781.1 hypothetical protein PSTT_02608 [Puccinia striiformis]POW23426.1 hypothetical protein PSHT_00143 [Puccinia striiformis]